MTPPNDELVRDALVAALPTDLEPPLERIHARVQYRRRRAQVRWGVGSVALAALVALVIGALPGGAARRRVDISTRPSRRHAVTTVVPTTKRPESTTIPAVVPPSAAHAVVPSLPIVTTVPGVAPTTVPAVAPPVTRARLTPTTQKATSPPTTAPLLAYERITLVLDDSGLHAPAEFTTAKQVDIIFLDQRTSATSVPYTGVRVTTADGQSLTILRPWYDVDSFGHFGAIGTVLHPLGVVTFQGVDTATNYSDIPNLYATSKFVAS